MTEHRPTTAVTNALVASVDDAIRVYARRDTRQTRLAAAGIVEHLRHHSGLVLVNRMQWTKMLLGPLLSMSDEDAAYLKVVEPDLCRQLVRLLEGD